MNKADLKMLPVNSCQTFQVYTSTSAGSFAAFVRMY